MLCLVAPAIAAVGRDAQRGIQRRATWRTPAPKYRFFSAAFAGCRWCVQWYVRNGLDPAIESDSRSHNALDWAVFGHQQGQQTDWVAGFLVAKGVEQLWKEEDVCSDPQSSEEWQPVEPLGTRGGGC